MFAAAMVVVLGVVWLEVVRLFLPVLESNGSILVPGSFVVLVTGLPLKWPVEVSGVPLLLLPTLGLGLWVSLTLFLLHQQKICNLIKHL